MGTGDGDALAEEACAAGISLDTGCTDAGGGSLSCIGGTDDTPAGGVLKIRHRHTVRLANPRNEKIHRLAGEFLLFLF